MENNEESSAVFVFTIAARNYLGQVSVLFDSIRKQCGDIKFCCFVVDGFDNDSEIPVSLLGNVFDCRKLGVVHFEEMAFKYDVVEFSTALKPFVFNYIFSATGYTSAVYFDPDIKLYKSLNWLEEVLKTKSVVVTPHVLDIEANGFGNRDRVPAVDLNSFLFVGTFNLGFIAIKREDSGISFVRWWADILKEKCFVEISQALFVDQKWADFLPSFFGEQLEVLRDPGANVGYWNIHERDLRKDVESNYIVNGSSLKFVHYSSIDLTDMTGISSNIPKNKNINLITYPEYNELFVTYKAELLRSGHNEKKTKTPYRFNYFEDGVTINKLHRRIYARLASEKKIPRPFSVGGEFYSILKKKKMLEGKLKPGDLKVTDIPNVNRKRKIVEFMFLVLFRLLGAKYYLPLLNELRRIANLETNTFLIK